MHGPTTNKRTGVSPEGVLESQNNQTATPQKKTTEKEGGGMTRAKKSESVIDQLIFSKSADEGHGIRRREGVKIRPWGKLGSQEKEKNISNPRHKKGRKKPWQMKSPKQTRKQKATRRRCLTHGHTCDGAPVST